MNKENVITLDNPVIAAASAMGAIFTTVGSAVMTAIGAISWPVVAVVAAIVAGALLIRKYWEPVSAFFGGVIEGLKAAFAPVGELFTPLKPVFDWLGEKLQAAWQWFKNLIAPVKATQDTLNRCRDTGVMFGQALADALMLPLNAFNKLRSGIDWVLEKLGVINKESDTLDQTAARTQAATYGSGGYIPATSSYAGYQAYQPVTAPAEYMAGEADNVFALTTVYATKAQAMRAAQAKWDKLQRGVAEFSIILATGRADIYTETPVKVSGFKRVIDEQDWTITKVTHFLNNSGFTTSLELEVRLSDVEYETEDDE